MNINNIATAAPVESMPLEVSTPVSAPMEVDAAQKAYNQPDSNRQTEKPKGDELSAEQTKQLAAELNEIYRRHCIMDEPTLRDEWARLNGQIK